MRPDFLSGLFALLVLVFLVGACGDEDSSVTADSSDDAAAPSAEGRWVKHRLGPVAADRQILGTAVGDGVVVLTVEEPGHVRGFVLSKGGAPVEAAMDVGSSEFRVLTVLADGPQGLVAMGNDVLAGFETVVLQSRDDGATWSEPATVGLEQPLDVADLLATDDRYVAVGAVRAAENPSNGGFVPAIVTSPNGTDWSFAHTPPATAGVVRSVVSTPAGLLAGGEVDGQPVLWQSGDEGSTWTETSGGHPADVLVTSGDVMLAAHNSAEPTGGQLTLHRSEDNGETWHIVDTGFAAEYDFVTLFGDQTGFALETRKSSAGPFASPERCYADPDSCGHPSDPSADDVVMVSDDGATWDHLDLSGLEGLFDAGSIVHSDSGDTFVLGVDEDGHWAAWTWDASAGEPPTTPAGAHSKPEYDGPPVIDNGATLELGVRYAFPLFLHCGMEHLGRFNGSLWGLTATPSGAQPETGSGHPVPDHWPMMHQSVLGYLTLVAENRIEYSLEDGEIIAVYEPLPPRTEPPMCA